MNLEDLVKARMLIAPVMAAAALVAAGCGGASHSNDNPRSRGGGGDKSLSLVAYSTPQVVMDDAIPAFQKTADGKGVSFKQSYGAWGAQSRAVESGLPADVVTFSLATDMTRLVDADIVDADWTNTPTKGFV